MVNEQLVAERIRLFREKSGMSLRELAKKSGIGPSSLSSVESGKSSPTVATLLKILDALNLTGPEFFASGTEPAIESIHFKRGDMPVIEDGEKLSRYLFPESTETRCVMTYEEYQPNTQNMERETHPRDFCIYVLEGILSLEVLGRGAFRLSVGDAAYLRAGTTHVSANKAESVLRMVVVEIK